MIVAMRKVWLVAPEQSREETLERLQALGVVHLAGQGHDSGTLEKLREQRSLLERALAELPALEKDGHGAAAPVSPEELERISRAAEQIIEFSDRAHALQEELEKLERERDRLSLWGDFDPEVVRRLEVSGVLARLHELTPDQYRRFPPDVRHWVVSRTREIVRVATITLPGEKAADLPEYPLPPYGPGELRERSKVRSAELARLREQLVALEEQTASLQRGLAFVGERLEFEQARADMVQEGKVAWLSGFVPVDLVERLKKAAVENGWALLVGEPAADEPVPTLVRTPRWVRIINPVFRILETVPGYREYDISFWFLLSFSLFFAMLIGDAGYGLLFLGLTVFARSRMRDKPADPFILLFILSAGTVIWGAVTGTWFGIEAIARLPFFSWLIIPQISSWSESSGRTIMLMCFLIGGIHLSIAHGINIVISFPHPKAFANLGWLSMVWGMYFVVRYIVMRLPLNPLAPWLVGGGFLLITIFEEQQGSFLKGMGMGLAKIPLKALNSISMLADIISYVRLFAVGLASLEIAKSFNAMAAGAGWGFPSGLVAAFILVLGHTLNIVMGGMSIIVHGVRLNMLEFSGHLGLEWSGFAYRPFSKRS